MDRCSRQVVRKLERPRARAPGAIAARVAPHPLSGAPRTGEAVVRLRPQPVALVLAGFERPAEAAEPVATWHAEAREIVARAPVVVATRVAWVHLARAPVNRAQSGVRAIKC
jgi:hypothetical protein